MEHADLYLLRETYNAKHILLCFNGPFSQGLIEEIGSALKKYMQSEAASSSSALDIFAVYIEIAQNIQHYSASQNYNDSDASATVVIARDSDGHYAISAGNIVEEADGEALVDRINQLATLDKTQLRAAYKEQLRKPREENAEGGAGLGLIDMARKASAPLSCSLRPVNAGQKYFFSLRVVI
jgi:hypothetical protein